MKVRDLIELNNFLTDIVIIVRKDGHALLDALHIGVDCGEKPPYPLKVPIDEQHIGSLTERRESTYIPKSINAWDDGKDYWQLKVERIPKRWLDLEVISWRLHPVTKWHHPRYKTNPIQDYNGIEVEVLPSGESLEVYEQKKAAKSEDDSDQMTIFDMEEL